MGLHVRARLSNLLLLILDGYCKCKDLMEAMILSFADPFGVEEMYVQTGVWGDDIPKYTAVRGSSPLEGYHRHLALVLSGANNSTDLSQGLLTEHKHVWNLRARISKRGQRDYGLTDTRPIEWIKECCLRQGLPHPNPEYAILKLETNERFGFDALSPGKEVLVGLPPVDLDAKIELPEIEDDGGASFFEEEEQDGKRLPCHLLQKLT